MTQPEYCAHLLHDDLTGCQNRDSSNEAWCRGCEGPRQPGKPTLLWGTEFTGAVCGAIYYFFTSFIYYFSLHFCHLLGQKPFGKAIPLVLGAVALLNAHVDKDTFLKKCSFKGPEK